MKCPGQDTQYWKPGAIFEVPCPQCGGTVEFFKDDPTRKCGRCGHRFVNPQMDFGCAAYCPFAEQCLGTLPEEALAQREDLLKDRVAVEVKRYFKQDFKRIGHASRSSRYAERIGKALQGRLAVILCAAYLLHTGKAQAEAILSRLGAKPVMIEAVAAIVDGGNQPTADASLESQIVHDADLIASLEDRQKDNPIAKDELAAMINGRCQTDAGRQVAVEVLL
jgi:hypothetical protein